MYHVFICYPRTYLAQVTPLHDALELALRNIYRRDAEVFQDTADLQAGNKWASDVDTALEHARVMIVVVVPTILQSPQCRREMLRFIETPGKHIVPLICEEVPRLKQLAEGVDSHPPGSEAHEIAVCAQALRTWQTYDFSHAVYQDPTETDYKKSIAELARMIRNKLDYEDNAAAAPADTGPARQDPQAAPRRASATSDADTSAGETGKARRTGGAAGAAGTGGHRTSRRGLLVVALLAVLAAGGYGVWSWRTPPAPVERFERPQAEALLSRVLANAASQAEHMSFEAGSGALRIAAPPVGSVATGIALQPGLDRMLKAGFVPGFADQTRVGDACFVLQGDPLRLEGDDLADGEFVSLRLRVFERAEAGAQKVCLTAGSTWQPVDARSAVVGSGAILAAPQEDARAYRTLRRGQEVPGPFWTNNDVPGWVRMEYRGEFAYLRRDLILELK